MNDFDYEAAQWKRLEDQKDKIAAKLREMADDVDRVAVLDLKADRRDPTRVVTDVTHVVLWGVANLHLDTFTSQAGEIYEARQHAE